MRYVVMFGWFVLLLVIGLVCTEVTFGMLQGLGVTVPAWHPERLGIMVTSIAGAKSCADWYYPRAR